MVSLQACLFFFEGAPCKGADGWDRQVRRRRGARSDGGREGDIIWLCLASEGSRPGAALASHAFSLAPAYIRKRRDRVAASDNSAVIRSAERATSRPRSGRAPRRCRE
jgi:hypothetical protein